MVLIEVLPHLLPDVSMERVVSSDMMCAITLESPNANCYLLRTLENIFGYSDVIYSVVYPTTSEIFIGNNIVIWDRSQVSANYLDLSSSIILMLTDQEQGFVYTYPFWFTPNYIPVISDLNTQTDPVLTAFFQCSWERTFTIQVGDLIYPASLFSPITFSNSASETITLTSGQLSWTPNVSSQSVTLIISFTGPGDLTTTKNFEVYVNSNSLPVCTIDPELLKVYKQKTFTIDLSIVCSDSDGEEILFEIIEGPDGMTLDNSVISWSTSLEDLGVKRKVTIFMTNQFGTCPEYYSFEIVPQPKIKISLETQDLYYGVAFRSVVLLENREFFEVHMLRYSISTSGNILIDSEYGIITWESPNQSETIQVTVAVDSSFYVADSKTSTFSLEIVSSSVVPEFNLGLPLSLEKKQVYANEMWQVEINCICPLDTPSITIISFTNTMELIGNILQWTPPVTFYDSGLVSLTCASSLFQTATTYSFILNPVNSLDPVPTCENINIDINYHNSYQYQTEFNWIIRDFSLYDLSLTIAENNFPNMKIFKRGLAYWNNADRPSSLINTILIDDTSKTNTCEIAIVFTNSTDPPDIINNNNLLCQVPPCTLEILTTGDPSAIYISNSDYILQSSNTFTWDPPGGVLIQETIFTAENEADQKSIDVVLCQNSECRKWPVIETIESDSCVIINQVLTCTYIYPETVIYLKITGRNFVGNSEVIVGNKYCVVTVQSNSEITCRLPPPSFGLSTYIVTVHRLDIDMYSPGKVIDYSHYYEAKALILDLGDLNPLIITPDSNGYYWVPINADLLFKTCTCYSQSTPGVFTYKSSIYSECKFEGLLSQEYTLTICCFGSCTSLTFYAVNDLTLSGPSPSEIYAHGLYPITISYSYTGPCTPSQIIFKLNSHLLRSSSPCSYSATLIVPPQDSSTTSIEIFISLNNGLTYSANSLTLTLSGFCSIGEYQLNGLCTLCPIGYMCDYNFSDKLSFFFTPIPCELGYYQDSEGQDSCIICPLGHQCFCRAGTSPIVCDAGFVCDELGIVKRWKACPKGNYCEEGTESYTFGDYKGPELCPEGNYCIYGVFTNISDPLDPYHPRPCENGASCPAGSSNPQGVINCEIGYFCRAGTIDKSNTDIFQFSEQCVSGKCQCPLGYYCPSSQLQSPVLCPKGKYQPNYASPSCEECPVGYYCPWNALVSPKSAIICEVGYRCPGSQSDQIKCSIGQYQNLEGQSACVNCKIGYYAPSLGMTACIICNEAYYCPTEGLVSPVPCLAMYYCYLPGINYDVQSINQTESDVFPSDLVASSEMRPQQCPKGYYCPLKSKQPTGCPIGSYQGFSGSTQCIGCPDGKLCPFTSMASPEDCPAGYYCADNKQAACPAGYYCLLNTETADPSSTSSNKPLPCPTGTYCTGGNTMGTSNSSDAYSAQLCSPGFYNDLPAQSACLPCPQGYECLTEGLSTPSICNAGTYRPFDIAQQYCIDCAEGTYNPDFGSISADSCINCIAGIVCNISGAIDQTSSYPCPAGYFCLEGTSRNTRNNNPCPAGYFCLEGTASYDEALVNPCPTGRYCASATAVDIITDCTDPTACNIGSICTANFYCPQGTAAMVECPSGTTSDNGAKSVDDCIRAADGFYLISVVQTAPVITSINVVEFSYYEFNLNFLQEFPNASMPQDYQLLISLTFPSRFRRLGETTTKNLLVSNNNYGTRLGVPLIYSSKDILVAGVDLKLGMQVNVNAVVSFEFQFLNSTYNKNYGWDNFEVPVDSMVSSLATDAASGFVCVLTRTIGAAIEDPINIYKTIQINDQNSAESAPVFEQRFSLSLITSDYSSVLENSTPKQNTTSLWATTSENNLVIPYLPYVTNCFPDYGANLPINELIKNKKCEFEPNPVNIKPLEVYTQVTGDRCNYKLTCDYIVDITNVKRSTRWYEAYTEEHNSRDPNKLNIPIFYISKNLLPRSTISNAILSQNVQIDFETTEVNVKIEMENRSWTIGDVPKSIELHLGYYQPLLNSTQILYAQMILKDMQPNSEFSDTLYNFTFHYFPLTWIQCFDLNAFDSSDYIFLTFVLASSAVATIGVFAVLSYFLCPKTWKIRGFSYVFSNSIDSSCGFFLAFIPVLLIIFGIWMVLYYAGALDYNVGNYSDTVPITDVNTDRVLMYRTGRLGISFFVLGLACISWAVDLAVPKKELQGLGYEAEKQELLEVKENPKEQGPLSWALLIAIGLCIMLDIVGQMPEYSENYYIILPILLTFEYFSGLFSMWAVQDFYYATHFKISLKVGIGITVLNCKTLTGMIASSFIIYGFKLVTQGFLEKYSQFYLVAYVIKYFKKLRFNTGGNKTSSVNNIQSINETSEKSLSFIVSYLYPVMSLAIYLNYENMNYRMLQVHYFYFFLLNIFFLAYEPLSSFFINAIRSTRDSAYQVPELYEKVQRQYKIRNVAWSLSEASYEVPGLATSQECKSQCKVGWSVQYYFNITLTGLGVYLIVFSIKLWQFAEFAPFFDLWMSVVAVTTYAACFILKNICVKIGGKVLWKIPAMQKRYQYGIDGNAIQSRSDFISDAALKKEIKKLMYEENTGILAVSDLTQIVVEILKDTSSENLAKIKLFRVFNDLDLSGKLDLNKIFDSFKQASNAYSLKFIDKNINKKQDPLKKVALIKEKYEREGKTLGKYPSELVYPWTNKEESHNLTFN